MFYKLNNFVFIRLINDRLFLFDKLTGENIHGDRVAYIFVKYLTYEPQHIDIILEQIVAEFNSSVERETIKTDLEIFYEEFVEKKILSKGESEFLCNSNETKFSYSSISNTQYSNTTENDDLIKIAKENSQDPQLLYIMLEITKYCNERCLHCYIPHESKNVFLSDNDFYKIIDECKQIGTIISFRVSGGECMSHPSFKKYIKYIKDNGFALTVLTNLTLLDDEIISILKEGLLSDVQVSLFSLDEKIHDKITTIPGSLKKTLENLDKLYNENIPVSIATQAMEINKDSIKDIYEYAEEHDFKLNFDWTIVAKEDKSIDNLDYRIRNISFYSELCKQRMKFNKKYREEFIETYSLKKCPESYLCNAGINGLHITPDLKTHPCPGWSINLGDLKHYSLKEIWQSSQKLKEIRQVKLRDFEKCVNCDKNTICHICMAQAYNESNGKFQMPDYVCQMYEVIRGTVFEK